MQNHPDTLRNILLIGFMGSGKTTVGKALADLTGWRFIDLDQYLCEAAGRTIPEIFASSGEQAFRQMETDTLRSLQAVERCIIATGGGVVGREENWLLMRSMGSTVFLDVPWDDLRARIQAQGGRPLADEKRGWDYVEALLRGRLPLYAEADLRLRCGNQNPEEIARKIGRVLGLTAQEN